MIFRASLRLPFLRLDIHADDTPQPQPDQYEDTEDDPLAGTAITVIVPNADAITHDITGLLNCICGPRIAVIHHALDGRSTE